MNIGIVPVSLIVAGTCGLCLLLLLLTSKPDNGNFTNRQSKALFAHPTIERQVVDRRGLQHHNLIGPNNAPQVPVTPEACHNPKLWGTAHRGGWNVCMDPLHAASDSSISGCIIYSYGLGADWSFDNAAELAGCEVHGFDPSGLLWRQGMHGRDYSRIDYAKQYPSRMKYFHNWGVGAAASAVYPPGTVPQEWPGLGDPQLSKSNSDSWLMLSIEQTMIDLGHLPGTHSSSSTGVVIRGGVRGARDIAGEKRETVGSKPIAVLKIDVEGAEWDALTALFGSEKAVKYILQGNVQQLLIEWHWDPDSRLRNERHRRVMDRVLELGFVPWKIERHVGSDCCLDMSYVWRREMVSSSVSNQWP